MNEHHMMDRGDGVRLAVRHREGTGTTVVFLPGYMSDMLGTKAEFLDALAVVRDFSLLRFDYSGCGQSEGTFDDGSIGRWAEDAEAVIRNHAPEGPIVLVGSSMGGWVMLRLAAMLGHRLRGLIGIAAAPDFTEWGLSVTAEEQAMLQATGAIERFSPWGDEPYRYTKRFLDDARENLFLNSEIPVTCPVRLLQGQQDEEVPEEIALRLAKSLRSTDVRVTLLKAGDHRLSDRESLRLLADTVEELL